MVRVSAAWKMAVALWAFLFLPAIVRCLEPIRIAADPQTAFAPLTVDVRIVVPRSDANREACLVLVSYGEATESCWTLNGANERIEWHRILRRLGPGEHTLVGVLKTTHGSVFTKPLRITALE